MIKLGMYAPVPHVTLKSEAIAESIRLADVPLQDGMVDPAFTLTKDVLTAADQNGFDIVLFAERHLGTDLEAWVLASSIASHTNHIQIMPAIHPGLWYPTLAAKMGSSLDRIAPGRLALNLITGWNDVEHTMFGGDLLLGQVDRYMRAEEYVQVLRGLWTNDVFSFKGKVYDIKDAKIMLKPASPGTPDIYTATRSEPGLEMVAKEGDWWFVDYDKNAETPDEIFECVKDSIRDMQERAAKYNREVRFAFNPFVVCDDTDEKAQKRACKIIEEGSDHDDGRLVERRMMPALRTGFVGSPDTIAEKMNRYYEAGIEMFLMKFPPTVEEVVKLGRELKSRFAGEQAAEEVSNG